MKERALLSRARFFMSSAMSLLGTFRTWLAGLTMSVHWGKADLAITSADFRE